MRVLFGATLTSVKVLTPSSITQNSPLSAFMVKKKKKKDPMSLILHRSTWQSLILIFKDTTFIGLFTAHALTRPAGFFSTIHYVFSEEPRAKNNSPFPHDLLFRGIVWRYTENTINGDTSLNGLNDVVNGNHAALQHIVHQWYQLWMMQWANYVNKRWWAMSGH